MDYEVKRLHARINALEVALVAVLKSDAKAMDVARAALTDAYELAVKLRDTESLGGFQTKVERQYREMTDKDAEALQVSTLSALREKLDVDD
ncbi:hypothetical protein [Burkholderia anthina]|uniref:hypothetical protein n=1 Tax=Burkholderia anthina TaxID=179879 RepID=UPI000F601DB5|nr:hypothetical protein [Burkholderia anthina]